MAQIIECDAHNREHPADWMMSRLDDGNTLAFCQAGLVDYARAVLEAVDQAEAAEAEAAALARLEATQAVGNAPDQADLAAADRDIADAQGEVAAADALADGLVAQGADPVEAREYADTATARTVRRGQSARAIAHRERAMAATRRKAAATTATRMPVNGDDPDDDEDDNEDAAAP